MSGKPEGIGKKATTSVIRLMDVGRSTVSMSTYPAQHRASIDSAWYVTRVYVVLPTTTRAHAHSHDGRVSATSALRHRPYVKSLKGLALWRCS